jgi:hypothetical protein
MIATLCLRRPADLVIALLACGSRLAIGDRNGPVRGHVRLLSAISSSHAAMLMAASP